MSSGDDPLDIGHGNNWRGCRGRRLVCWGISGAASAAGIDPKAEGRRPSRRTAGSPKKTHSERGARRGVRFGALGLGGKN